MPSCLSLLLWCSHLSRESVSPRVHFVLLLVCQAWVMKFISVFPSSIVFLRCLQMTLLRNSRFHLLWISVLVSIVLTWIKHGGCVCFCSLNSTSVFLHFNQSSPPFILSFFLSSTLDFSPDKPYLNCTSPVLSSSICCYPLVKITSM